MAVNEIEIAATPDEVWEALARPGSYDEWVVGAKEIRGADEGFPSLGTRLHHTIGAGPFTIRDSTVVVRSERPHVLQLHARMGALGSAHISLRLEPVDGGTRVVMKERGARGVTRFVQPATDLLLRGRNFVSLEKLRDLVERRG